MTMCIIENCRDDMGVRGVRVVRSLRPRGYRAVKRLELEDLGE